MIERFFVLLVVFVAACGSPDTVPEPAPLPVPRVWTRAFLQPAVLIADEIRIEGPEDLLEHFAAQQDPDIATYTTRNTAEGLLQEMVMHPGIGGVEIVAQLDALELRALRRLVVLQRFEDVPVTVRGHGNAFWASAVGMGEKRDRTIVLQGTRGE